LYSSGALYSINGNARFGKYKLFVQKKKLQGIGKLILTIQAFTANITLPAIKEAFETVRFIDFQINNFTLAHFNLLKNKR